MRFSFRLILAKPELQRQLLYFTEAQSYALVLDSNEHEDQYGQFDFLAAWAKPHHPILATDLEELESRIGEKKHWLFGHLSFELKDDFENLSSRHSDDFALPGLQFFSAETVVLLRDGQWWVYSDEIRDEQQFWDLIPNIPSSAPVSHIELVPQQSKAEYLHQVDSLKQHLQLGNIYEVNYCMELSARNVAINAAQTFDRLNQNARAPFAAFYKSESFRLICASPERYLARSGERLISQPIKGTAARGQNPAEDERQKKALLASEKERSENVMITDLVRNDLSRTAKAGTVKVEELFGVYAFNTVFQLITTISSELRDGISFTDILKSSFPMGSMTGAPKIAALQLIDEHESFARGLYSGSVGYITPAGDFDFNVVIRSMLYDEKQKLLSARVGSAITIHCDAEAEYEECLLKARALQLALQG